jgi:ABC-type phosphate transport system substrate-binding protein
MLGFGSKKSAGARARVALIAGATVAALGLGGLNAGSASAANCTGGNITGQGSSLQKIAQQNVWDPAFSSTICPGGPTVTYLSTGSGAGMHEWNYDGATGTINHERMFIGTDDAPTSAQIANIKSAASAGAQVAVIPVTQTAISIPANLPAGCEVEAITNTDLQKVFRGALLTWSALETAEGTCSAPIVRVVRKDGSGTSFQLKNYLSRMNGGALACAEGKTWKELEPISNPTTGAPNTTWPEKCEGNNLSEVVRSTSTGGGALITKLKETPGAIGYAALPDAKANAAPTILALENNGQKPAFEGTFADPASGTAANCSATPYVVPADGRRVAGASGLDVDWSQVFGAYPAIGGSSYPLCTLTYDLAFKGYKAAGFLFKDFVTAKSFLREYVVSETGQTAIETAGSYYAPLPTSGAAKNDVLGAAQFAGGKLSF